MQLKSFITKLSAVLVLSLTLMIPFVIQPAQASADSWTTKAPMLTQRVGFGIAVANGKIYVIGGMVGGSNYCWLTNVEEYDPVSDTWTEKTPMPTPRAYFGIAVCQDKIYAIGGVVGWDNGKSVSIVSAVNEVYDPTKDTWETKTSMPTARQRICVGVVNDKVYLLGGAPTQTSPWPPLNVTYANEVYNPATDGWSMKEPLPNSVAYGSCSVIDKKIYVISGNQNLIYDSVAEVWSMGANLPEALSASGMASTTGLIAPKRIYVMGGQKSGLFDVSNSNYVYNPEEDTWISAAPLPSPRAGAGIAVLDDILYVMGGNENLMGPPSAYLTQNLQYTPLGYGTVPPFLPTVPIAAASVVAAVVVAAGLLVYHKKHNRSFVPISTSLTD